MEIIGNKGSCFLIIFLWMGSGFMAVNAQENDTIPKKGSYLYWGQPGIEDNSMLIEEAFNQESGVIQHISNFLWDDINGGDFITSYTQEIPLDDYRHQLSFTLLYPVIKMPLDFPPTSTRQLSSSGFGDLYINYRPLLWNKMDWALVIPRFTVIIPTGNSKDGLGSGGWGYQFNLAVTKRITPKLNLNYNGGFTYVSKADRYNDDGTGNLVLSHERNLNFYNQGGSLIYLVSPHFNVLCEYVTNWERDIEATGQITKSHQHTVNPAIRFAFNIGKVQIVPGIGMPMNFYGKGFDFDRFGVFGYLSIEPDYTK